MLKKISCTCLLLGIVSCGPDPITRASETQWSTKNESIVLGAGNVADQKVRLVDEDAVITKSLSLLEEATESDNARYRANAIEALRHAPSPILLKTIRRGLADENRGVRFVAAMMVGEVQVCELMSLLEPLLLDDSESVKAAALCSMYRCGRSVDLNLLARMLDSEDPELRGNAVMILGRMGNSSAVEMIRATAHRSPTNITPIRRRLINLQMAEALVQLGERQELEVIRAAIFSSIQEAEVTALACQIAGRLHDVEITSTLQGIAATPDRYPDEIRLIAAAALAEMDPSRVPMEIVLRFTSSELASLRSQCATVLGVHGNSLSLGPLALLLKDNDPLVQIAAAGAVIRIDKGHSAVIVD
ncbi:MAG: HEAT repeat domain-containing protein [Planctomycetota bacterium]|nr:HEAT repeat domain-containing protein [Planctomycetota bacterium]